MPAWAEGVCPQAAPAGHRPPSAVSLPAFPFCPGGTAMPQPLPSAAVGAAQRLQAALGSLSLDTGASRPPPPRASGPAPSGMTAVSAPRERPRARRGHYYQGNRTRTNPGTRRRRSLPACGCPSVCTPSGTVARGPEFASGACSRWARSSAGAASPALRPRCLGSGGQKREASGHRRPEPEVVTDAYRRASGFEVHNVTGSISAEIR